MATASAPYDDPVARHFGDRVFVRSLDGRFVAADPTLERVLGLPVDRVLGRSSHELYPAAVAARHEANDRLVVQENRALSVSECAVDAEGFLRSYVVYKFPVRSADGEVIAVGGLPLEATARTTQQQCAQQSLAVSEARFRAVFDHAPIGQIYSDLDGRVTSVNEPMARILGYAPEEIVGHGTLEFVHPDEPARIRITMKALLDGTEQSVSAVRRFVHRDGHVVPVRVSSALLRDHAGAPRWWVSMVADISEEERTQAELEAAHATAVLAARRMQLLHTVAAAANDASSAVELAPPVLAAICAHFGWTAGALVAWPADAPAGTIVRHGKALATPAVPLGSATEVRPGQGVDDTTVIVPVSSTASQSMAFVFSATSPSLDPDEYDLLDVVAREGRRLVERELSARLLLDSEARFRSVFDSSPLPMGLTLGDTGTYSAVNDAMCHMLGRRKDELIGASARDICHPDDIVLTDPAGAAALAAPDGRHTFELRLMHSSGDVVIANVTLAWMDGPDGTRQLLGQFEDITARRTVEQMLRRQADHDGLTGLANRSFLGRVLAERAKDGGICSVLFIDVDGFKLINDTRGHDVGDEVLLTVATRLQAAVRPTDLVVRFGGDEFVVLCDAVDHDAYSVAAQVAQRVKFQLAEPIITRDGSASITASIGIAAGAVETSSPLDLVQRADAAMYEAKRLGKDRSEVYDVRLHERTRRDQQTEAALRNALADHRFVVHYQPVVALESGEVVGFEALVRLVDEAGALVMPDRFIAVAERSGLIVPMGAWVLQESCRTVSELRRRTGRPLTIAVNIAARQAARSDLADTVREALDASGLPDDALTLELTESALLEADDSTLDQLVALRRRGVEIGLDDFGTGYSSLTYLRRFPVSHLKVDRSFVSGVNSDASDRAIVRAVTQLADELGLGWVAEGIETDDQLGVLSAMGAGLGQGYLFSRPVPTDQLPALLGLADPPLQATA